MREKIQIKSLVHSDFQNVNSLFQNILMSRAPAGAGLIYVSLNLLSQQFTKAGFQGLYEQLNYVTRSLSGA